MLTMLAVITARMIPTLTLHEIFWRLPYSTASWLFVQSARKNGVKGIGKKREDQALFRRWQELKKLKSKTTVTGREQ